MATIEIVETTLQDGTVGKCCYLEVSKEQRMTIEKHLISDSTYTLSFFVKPDNSQNIEIVGGAKSVDFSGEVWQDKWEKLKFTFVSDGEYVQLYFPTGNYYFYALKLEDGKVATTWTPSFFDTKTETESIIDQKADGITLKVEQSVLQKVGEDFVTKENIVGEINLQIEEGKSEARIIADAITLEGYTTIGDKVKFLPDGSLEINDGRLNIGTSSETEDVIELNFTDADGDEYHNKLSPYALQANIEHGGNSYTSYVIGNGIVSNFYDASTNKNTRADVSYDQIKLSKDGETKNRFLADENGVVAKAVKTNNGADLDIVKEKADGSLKSTFFNSARGTASAYPSVNIASIPVGTKIRIEIGVPIDNSGTISWMSYSTVKSNDDTDYLLNIGGYYYSNTYNASVFINLSKSRVTFNDSWTRVVGGTAGTNVSNLKSLSRINVYTENL